jgi:DNA-directed RNA polymerase specialized sigma24 family protein
LGGNLSSRTKSRLSTLFERSRRLETACREAKDELARATREASDVEGASRSEIADALGVGTSTVQGWVVRGRRLTD